MDGDNVIEIMKGNQALRYFIVSATCLICYEYLIMLESEVRSLWSRRHVSFGGILLFLCRYFPFASLLAIRVYITERNLSDCTSGFRNVRRMGEFYENIMFPCANICVTNGCICRNRRDVLWIALIAFLVAECIPLGLLLVKTMIHRRRLRVLHRDSSSKSILTIMAQDGIAYFAFNLVIGITNVIFIRLFSVEVQDGLLLLSCVAG
ncbi:hypothetical protein SCHPADRAFT_590666 [Schizopora paradoxa]|uniref:DUF6533 domain-containing protein n=1 Tax=Schizopora paradoxa TaxID=27342 RepID=A0A0H2RHA3_9AGAM|nr:hypothetical protein SCHPADRAFT_590666 [Schizopora paradoxa]